MKKKVIISSLTIVTAAGGRTLLILMLFIASTAAQTTAPVDRGADANRLYDEGRQLADGGKNSGSRSDEEISSDRKAAIDKFTAARDIFRATGNRKSEGHCLSEIGRLYSELAEHQKAFEFHLQAIEVFKATNDPDEEAIAIGHLGTSYRKAAEYSKAIDAYPKTLTLGRRTGDKYTQAQALQEIGNSYFAAGEFRKSLENYLAALPLYRELGKKGSEGEILNKVGGNYLVLSELREAKGWLEQSLDFHRKNGLRYSETRTLGMLALLYGTLNENQKALEYFEARLSRLTELNDPSGVAETRAQIASLFDQMGRPDQALAAYRAALASFRLLQRRAGIATSLKNIGEILRKSEKTSKESLDHFNEALEIAKEIRDRSLQAEILLEIGILYSENKDQQNALKYKQESFALYESMGQLSQTANGLNQIGISHWSANDHQRAFVYFNFAYAIAAYIGDISAEADVLKWLQNVDTPPALTIFYGKAAVNKLQARRSKASTLDKEAQKAFLRSFEVLYRRLAEQLLREDRVSEAYQVLNAFKDQQFYDSDPEGVSKLVLQLTPEEDAFLKMSESANLAIAKANIDQQELARLASSCQLTPEEQIKMKENSAASKTAQEKFIGFLAGAWDKLPADIKPPVTKEIIELQAILKNLGEQGVEEPVVVYQYVGNSAYYSLIITATTIKKVTSPSDFYATNAAAKKFWAVVQSDKYDPKPAAKELYDTVFKPIERELPVGTKTILWSLDGNLRYVPMAALYDGKQYLVERFNHITFTRADGDRLTRAVSPKWTAVAFGSSKAHSVEVLGNRSAFSALPGVGAELDTLFGKTKRRGVLGGNVLLDESFTQKAMLERLDAKSPVVHIASHFSFRPGDETRSFLLLGDGTPFTLADMKTHKNLFAGVELLTLSACNTAAQQADANGREVDAFFELAQRLGAQSVMATLWPVADNSTPWLMREFYDLKVNKKQNKAEALRNAQVALLHGSATTSRSTVRTDASSVRIVVGDENGAKSPASRGEIFVIAKKDAKPFVADPRRPFAHPFYWSPFVLIGNWR